MTICKSAGDYVSFFSGRNCITLEFVYDLSNGNSDALETLRLIPVNGNKLTAAKMIYIWKFGICCMLIVYISSILHYMTSSITKIYIIFIPFYLIYSKLIYYKISNNIMIQDIISSLYSIYHHSFYISK